MKSPFSTSIHHSWHGKLPCHEWCLELETSDFNMKKFSNHLNSALCNRNIYYRDLIEGKVLQPMVIRTLEKGAFNDYMRLQGKLGGQNKIPRLANHRDIVNKLRKLK